MATASKASFRGALANRRLWLSAAMGFAGGLPILLTVTVLQAWLTAESIDLATIGFFALIALPYNVKFLWAPVLDRFNPLGLGRRRSWLVITQIALVVGIAALGVQDPSYGIWKIAVAALVVTLFSATQDIVIDAYRRESLSDDEQGLGASMYVYGYRLGTLVASAGGLILADRMGFSGVYYVMAGIMLAMVAVTLAAPEPVSCSERPASLRMAFVAPFQEFFHRHARASQTALLLVFVLVYNLGVHLCGHMLIPFYLDMGFTNTEIGAVSSVFGVGPFLLGVLAGGALQLRVGLQRSLVATSVVKILAICSMVLLLWAAKNVWLLATVMGVLSLAVGMGTTTLMGFIANLTDVRFTATQFALLTAIAALPRTVLAAPTGWLVTEIGWVGFFLFCASMALPGLIILLVNGKSLTETTIQQGT